MLLTLFAGCTMSLSAAAVNNDRWPDGSKMDTWFQDTTRVDVNTLGRRYVVTDYQVGLDSTVVQTRALQQVIDRCHREGGGVVVVPRGTFLTGALFLKDGVNLMVEKGGKLKGSDRIGDYPLMKTRIEGETCTYYPAIINADSVSNIVLCGEGTIDGNGARFWEDFWLRRKWNPKCTNKDSQRPRLVYISHSNNVTLQDLHLQNSPFWTNHVYKSDHIRFLRLSIYAPTSGLRAPSSDAIDLDVCSDVLVYGCYMNVNDDAVVLKGGKGTWADKNPDNGANERILIDRCHYNTVHGCLTLGSESLHDRNVILRNCVADNAQRVLWLKMRPDTPQHYEYVTVENMKGRAKSFIVVRPWTQFFKQEKRDDMPKSVCNDITLRGIEMTCQNFFDVGKSDKYDLHDFTFEDIDVKDEKQAFNKETITNTKVKNVKINGVRQK